MVTHGTGYTLLGFRSSHHRSFHSKSFPRAHFGSPFLVSFAFEHYRKSASSEPVRMLRIMSSTMDPSSLSYTK